MKSIAIAILAAAAMPLLADEPQKTTTTTAPATTTAAPATTTPATTDSPLVAASKAHAAKTKKKSTIVITNDNLKKDGGHFTTTTNQLELPKPTRTEIVTEMDEATKKRAEEFEKQQAAKAAKAKADHDRRMAMANREIEGDTPESLYDDPAEVEHRAEQQTSTAASQKPPL